MRWSEVMCAALRESRPMSPPRVAETLASGLAADPLFCDLLANVRLNPEHKMALARAVEIGGSRFSGL
jgi:hypothetical protein